LPILAARVIAAVGVLALVMGLFLFLLPAAAMALWPWPLTPLTARVLGVVFCLGLAGIGAPIDRRWSSARLPFQVAGVMLSAVLVAGVRALPSSIRRSCSAGCWRLGRRGDRRGGGDVLADGVAGTAAMTHRIEGLLWLLSAVSTNPSHQRPAPPQAELVSEGMQRSSAVTGGGEKPHFKPPPQLPPSLPLEAARVRVSPPPPLRSGR
jgi:hypothetical protein